MLLVSSTLLQNGIGVFTYCVLKSHGYDSSMSTDYDTPSTPEDRAKVRAAATARAMKLQLLADRLHNVAQIVAHARPLAAQVCFDAVTELRHLAQGSDETVLDIIREKLAGGAVE